MRPIHLFVVILLVAPGLLPTGSATEPQDYEYMLAPTVAVPGFRTNIALCDSPEDPCIGGVLFKVEGRHIIALADDDLLSGNTAMMLCVWEAPADACHAGAHMDGPRCDGAELSRLPRDVTDGVVFLYGIFVGDDHELCGATQGTLSVTVL